MEDGKKLNTELGTVQGGLISPVLANVYLHYVLDTWFAHYNGKSHWGKYCVLHRTSKKKLKQKRQSAKEWLREHMHESIPETIEKRNKKLVGHYRYYGIYGNWISLKKFYSYVKYELWRTKRRRDQSCWLTWGKFKEILRIYPIVWPRVYLTSAY